jgi:hypothetical protein
MKAIPWLALCFASFALADEAADRMVICRTIAALNELPRRTVLFTGDANASSELERLPKVAARTFGTASGATVTISHEPMGEATIHLPDTLEILNPRIACGTLRFITPEVALADASWTYQGEGAATQTVPLLFVMKKEGADWKIAALRILAPH